MKPSTTAARIAMGATVGAVAAPFIMAATVQPEGDNTAAKVAGAAGAVSGATAVLSGGAAILLAAVGS